MLPGGNIPAPREFPPTRAARVLSPRSVPVLLRLILLLVAPGTSQRLAPWLVIFGIAVFWASASMAGPPAAPSSVSPALAKAEHSFDQFAQRWIQKMETVEQGKRRQARASRTGRKGKVQYRAYPGAFKTRLRPTGYARAPFVGVLEYAEELMVCEPGRSGTCRAAGRTPVTEVFRYQNGRWVY